MELEDVRKEIVTFWADEQLPFGNGNPEALARLEHEYGSNIPEPVRRYVSGFLPEGDRGYEDLARWREVFGYKKLSNRAMGYSYNPITSEAYPEWKPGWLLIGTQEGNPYIVDLAESSAKEACPVLWAEHGAGKWRFMPISASLSTFVLCTCYVHHAMVHLRKKWPDTVESRLLRPKRRRLAGDVSKWLADKIKSCEPLYWAHWYSERW